MNNLKNLEKNILALQKQDKLVILRYCGGSEQQAILAALTKNYNRVDLSLPNLRLQAEQNPQLFMQGRLLPVYLADLHYAPSLLNYLLSSELPLGQIIASCSQSYYLSEQAQGQRAALLELPLRISGGPLLIPEPAVLRKLADCTEKNNLPAAILQSNIIDDAAAYVRRLLQQDIMERTTASDEIKFYRFLCVVASMLGSVVNYSSLAASVEITAPTAKQWLQFLAGTGLVYLLQPVTGIAGKRLVKAPKLYFKDTGVAAQLLQICDLPTLLQSVYFKNLFENYVVNAVRESFLQQGIEPELRFYKDSNNKEINLLLTWQQALYPLYIAKDKFYGRKLEKSSEIMQEYACKHGLALGTSCVFTLGGCGRQLSERLWQLNAEAL